MGFCTRWCSVAWHAKVACVPWEANPEGDLGARANAMMHCETLGKFLTPLHTDHPIWPLTAGGLLIT